MKTKSIIFLLFAFLLMCSPQISEAQSSITEYQVFPDGLNGKKLIKSLEKEGVHLYDYVLPALNYYELGSEFGGKLDLVIIRGNEIKLDTFESNNAWKALEKVEKFGVGKGYSKPPLEAAVLLRKKITPEQMKKMGLTTIVVVHEPIKSPDNLPVLFAMDDKNNFYYCFCYGGGKFGIDKVGFVFWDTQKTYLGTLK